MGDPEYLSFTNDQVDVLSGIVEELKRGGIDPGLIHAANSGGIIGHPRSHFDLVRPGIMLYGYYPSREQARELDLRPVMGLETRIVFLKRVPAGTGISYGLTYRTSRETTIATIPCGYGDGYSRLLSGKSKVLVNGKLYPVAGRVCMDQTMVDLGPDSRAELFDRVVLFGPDPGAPTAEDLAEIIGTIPYEITCNINKRVPRVYTDSRLS
jgi:alanine racemase